MVGFFSGLFRYISAEKILIFRLFNMNIRQNTVIWATGIVQFCRGLLKRIKQRIFPEKPEKQEEES
jgi:hypothetical protein